MFETTNQWHAGDPTAAGVLARLATGPRERLLGLGRAARYERGAHLLAEGADTPFLAIIEQGRVALRLRIPERGERMTFATIEPGEVLGWSALVPPYRATAEAVAIEETHVLAFDATELRDLLAHEPEVATALLPIVLEAVAHRLTTSWHQLLDTFSARTAGPW
jgi:CRP-like cAMP-binding protein